MPMSSRWSMLETNNLVPIPLGLAGELYRSPMPFAAFDLGMTTLEEYLEAGVDTVVMLIEQGEDLLRSGRDLTATYSKSGIDTIHFPIYDFETPEDRTGFSSVLDQVIGLVKEGKHVAVHCFAGRGRTGMFIALVGRKVLGLEGQEAIDWVRGIFPGIETSSQEQLIRDFDPL